MDYEILIRGGRIVDGTGAAGHTADLGIAHGQILAIGADLPGHAEKEVDANGMVVAPGFIDIKTHSDFTLPINPKAESKVRQGVTTEIIGHCGFSVAPVLPGKVQLLKDYLSPSAPWLPFRETSFPDYLDALQKAEREREHTSVELWQDIRLLQKLRGFLLRPEAWDMVFQFAREWHLLRK